MSGGELVAWRRKLPEDVHPFSSSARRDHRAHAAYPDKEKQCFHRNAWKPTCAMQPCSAAKRSRCRRLSASLARAIRSVSSTMQSRCARSALSRMSLTDSLAALANGISRARAYAALRVHRGVCTRPGTGAGRGGFRPGRTLSAAGLHAGDAATESAHPRADDHDADARLARGGPSGVPDRSAGGLRRDRRRSPDAGRCR